MNKRNTGQSATGNSSLVSLVFDCTILAIRWSLLMCIIDRKQMLIFLPHNLWKSESPFIQS